MKTLRNLLLVLTSLIATVAFALTPAERILLFGKINPVWTANFLTTTYGWSWSGSAWVSSPAGLTYAGQNQKYQFDSTGTLTTGPNNQLTYSNTYTNSAWQKASVTLTTGQSDPFGGTAATLVTATGANADLYQQYIGTNATPQLGSIWIRRASGAGQIKVINAQGARINITVTGSWTQISSGATSVSANPFWGIEIATNGDAVYVYGATSSAVTYESFARPGDQVITQGTAFYGPRQDYSYNGSAWVPAGMLVEQASSGNYAKYSQDFSQSAWGKYTSGAATGSISANSVTDPASTTTGAYISINRAAAFEYAEYYQSFTGTAASWTGSFFLKAHAGGDVGKTVSIAAYNGSTVVAGTTVTLTASWVRYSVTGTMAASGSCNFAIGYVASTDYAGAPTQTGAVGFDVAFGQFDNTSFPLSYLPNPTASSPGPSRAADVVSFNGVPLAAGAGTSGTAIVQITDAAVQASTSTPLLGNATSNGPLYFTTSYAARTWNGTNFITTANTATFTNPNRAAIAWSPAGRSIVLNGSTVVTDANGISAPSVLGANQASGGTLWLNGHLASTSFYNQRLPDPTLKAKSVVGAPY